LPDRVSTRKADQPSEAAGEAVALARRAVEGGDRRALARLISWIENGSPGVAEAVALLYRESSRTYCLGITGAPGSGKSTLTDRLISALRERGQTVAVLAVDPSSPFSGGAVLGDRIRMSEHAGDLGVFIRSLANRGHLGGLSAAVPQVARALDAFGFDWTIVETVGVGQAEVEVAGETDTTVVVVTPGWGDHVQASKAGLLEIADVFVVNKADRPGAKATARDLRLELKLAEAGGGWRPPIVLASSATGDGVDDVLAAAEEHRAHLEADGGLDSRRRARLLAEVRALVREHALRQAERELSGRRFDALIEEVFARRLDPAAAVRELLPDSGERFG
jgi:LAO/AO transport system kinase